MTDSSNEAAMKENLARLMSQRELLEIEADAIGSELTTPGVNGEPPAGIKDSLIDSEGYPRGDIDIYNVKAKRKRLAEINVDYKLLMKQIETAMMNLYQSFPPDNRDTIGKSSSTTDGSERSETNKSVESKPQTLQPIAILDEILATSPASTAGIQEGDELIQFGHINSSLVNCLTFIPKLVGESINKEIAMVVRRKKAGGSERELINLSITPTTWGGRGLLGCHLSPLK